jgi:chromosome segregation ATPase
MIDQRIKSLQELLKRLEGMKLLPADTLVTIQTAINAEIQTLTDLKAKIATDTATTTIKADAQSITKANRVYLLVEPKARIAAAASRVNAVVTQMQALSVKLQARLTAAQTAGADITASSAALTDFNAKIADAKVQADAAVTETANLQVDNGDKTILAANLAALKDARAKLDAAQKDLVAARQDAAKIYGIVKGKEGKGNGVSASATTSAETH